RLAEVLAGLSEGDAAALIEESWSLAGVTPVGGRGPAEIAQRLIRRAEAARAPTLSEAQAAAIRDFMAITDAPQAALAAVGDLGGRQSPGLASALEAWNGRLDALAMTAPYEAMRFAPALGHAFDYYDGLTFEVRSAALGDQRPVAVG